MFARPEPPSSSSSPLWSRKIPIRLWRLVRRFIPNRESMDIGYANAVLTERKRGKENPVKMSASSEAYQKLLAETFDMNQRILTFKDKPLIEHQFKIQMKSIVIFSQHSYLIFCLCIQVDDGVCLCIQIDDRWDRVVFVFVL